MKVPERSFISIQVIHVAVFDAIPADVIRSGHDPSCQVVLGIITGPGVVVTTMVDEIFKNWLDVACV